jgi:hypothetical protein
VACGVKVVREPFLAISNAENNGRLNPISPWTQV